MAAFAMGIPRTEAAVNRCFASALTRADIPKGPGRYLMRTTTNQQGTIAKKCFVKKSSTGWVSWTQKAHFC